jgi:DNA-binding CsgD family transcriptional regulator
MLFKGQANTEDLNFATSCGVPVIDQMFVHTLTSLGFSHQHDASVHVILDAPTGFALSTFGALPKTSARHIIVTWNMCPEYWEDLWDLRPHILLVYRGMMTELASAITQAAQDIRYRLIPDSATPLSPAERRVLRLLAHGETNQQIAERMVLRCQSLKNVITGIYQKLGVKNRSEAILYYWNVAGVFAGS